MKHIAYYIIVLTVILSGGCGPDREGIGKQGDKKLVVKAPETGLKVKQGNTAEFSVAIERQNFDEQVELEFTLPEGVQLETKNTMIPKGANTLALRIKVDENTKPEKKLQIQINGNSGTLKTTEPANLEVEILASLATQQQNKQNYVDKLDKQLIDIDASLKQLTEKANQLENEEEKADLLKELSERFETRKELTESVKSLKESNIENWEVEQAKVDNKVKQLEEAIQSLEKNK